MKLTDSQWSVALCRQMVWLAGASDSYQRAEETLWRIGGVSISDSSVWRQVQRWGKRFADVAKAEVAASQEEVTATEMKQQARPTAAAKGVAMDGAMLHLRGEGWKELKVGCVFDILAQPSRRRETGHWEAKARAVNNRYVSHLGTPEPFGQKVWSQARAHGWFDAPKTVVLGDGASWIWRQADHHFVGSHQLVDWYHATEHLHAAALLIHPEEGPSRTAWYEASKAKLYAGQAADLADGLVDQAVALPPARADALEVEAGYFANNSERMAYACLRQAGFPIGSGMVESGCKQFKARFAGPGMRWSRSGAKQLLSIRAAVMGDCFDAAWQQAASLPLI